MSLSAVGLEEDEEEEARRASNRLHILNGTNFEIFEIIERMRLTSPAHWTHVETKKTISNLLES